MAASEKLIGCNPAGTNPLNPAAGSANFIGVFSCGQLAATKAKGDGFYDTDVNFENPTSLLEQWQIINTTTWRASDNLTIKNIVSYAQLRDVQRTPLFGTDWSAATIPNGLQRLHLQSRAFRSSPKAPRSRAAPRRTSRPRPKSFRSRVRRSTTS